MPMAQAITNQPFRFRGIWDEGEIHEPARQPQAQGIHAPCVPHGRTEGGLQSDLAPGPWKLQRRHDRKGREEKPPLGHRRPVRHPHPRGILLPAPPRLLATSARKETTPISITTPKGSSLLWPGVVFFLFFLLFTICFWRNLVRTRKRLSLR